jgi:flavorubredoxin
MPREIAPGVFWIGDCLAQRHKGKVYHGYNAAFLIAGEAASCLVETGHPKDFPVIERHMNELFARGVAPLKYLFVTHQETPHCGGLGRVPGPFPTRFCAATSATITWRSRNTSIACAG